MQEPADNIAAGNCLGINMQQQLTKDTIFTYIALDKEGDKHYIYDPRTDKHYEVDKSKYDEVMKNANK